MPVKRLRHPDIHHHRIAALLADHTDEVKAVAAALLQINRVISAAITGWRGLGDHVVSWIWLTYIKAL